ncbi:MAG: hypothetical protein LUI87_12405 [Lachnospiraceae bacterium]|nr:hypothetical protein [Lachnospiraceae bacterium]
MKGRYLRKIRKMAAVFLTAAMMVQQCSIAGIAAETGQEAQTVAEAETQVSADTQTETAAAETQTQTDSVSTEAQATEAAQESTAQTETVTTETTAPETSAQTETAAPETSAQTETDASEASAQTETAASETSAQTETAAPETSAQTDAQTEAQSDSSTGQTEGETSTESQTSEAETKAQDTETDKEAAQTEKESAQSEMESESAAESETGAETETESETERSARVNSGKEIKRKALEKQLADVSQYLFVAKNVSIPQKVEAALLLKEKDSENDTAEDAASAASADATEEAFSDETADATEEAFSDKTADATERTFSDEAEEALETNAAAALAEDESIMDALILSGNEAALALADLEKVAISLADAQSTKDVTVLNLYMDAEGNLDETQLEDLYSDKILDVTDMIYIINIVADAKDQEIEFAGYAMKSSGKIADYTDEAEAGSVLYNFVALEDDAYVSYEGTLKLSDDLQGTFLAPKASVEIDGNLAGAVYAEAVTVKNENAKLLRIIYSVGEDETEAESEAETETEIETEAETKTEIETETETESEAETEPEADTESETETETETEAETETETEPETNSGNRGNAGILSSADASQGVSAVSETESESDTETESDAKAASLDDTASTETAADKSITVSAQALYGETVLTAEKDITYYAALFAYSTDETAAGISQSRTSQSETAAGINASTISSATGTSLIQVSDVQALTIQSGSTSGESVTFDGLTAGTYYVAATDAEGNLLSETSTSQTSPQASAVEVTLTDAVTAETVILEYQYTESWPEGAFSYTVELSLTLDVVDRDGSALSGTEVFYVSIYEDAAHTTAAAETPITFSMGGESAKTCTYTLKATSPSQTFYLAETDSDGNLVTTGEDGFAYMVSFADSDAVTVECGDTEAAVTIQNKLNDSTITIQVEDASDGTLLSGAVLAVKDSSGNILEVETVGSKTFSSGTAQLVWTNALTDGETYYLTEITAPDGYTPIPDVEFTVIRGCTTEVTLANAKIVESDYALTVTKEVYAGDYQVYAYDTTTGSYKESGAYTYYVALFSDAGRKNKVSNVVSLDVSGFTGTVTFSNLTANGIYYLSETDEYGVVVSSSDALTVRYTNSGQVQLSQKASSMVVQNVYASLPDGYRYTGTLTLTLNTTDSSGTAEAVTNTFYIGIYRNADYSDTPTIVKMDLQNASSVSVRRRILLSGENDMTYYIAEVDASGNRITDSSDFSYVVTVDKPTVTIAKGANQTVTVTNKLKATKATLYLTKRVYEGTSLKAVSETFYVGLFKDAELTTLYADPIAMTLDNASELTLKLTLNLGTASGVTIYIAEVDQDGSVITNQRSFGYQIKVINATAEFTQDNLTIQTIIMNSVYGSTSDDDWESIINSASSDLLSDSSYYTVDDNGSVSGELSSVQTGDDTPLLGYVLLMGAAMILFGAGIRRRCSCR